MLVSLLASFHFQIDLSEMHLSARKQWEIQRLRLFHKYSWCKNRVNTFNLPKNDETSAPTTIHAGVEKNCTAQRLVRVSEGGHFLSSQPITEQMRNVLWVTPEDSVCFYFVGSFQFQVKKTTTPIFKITFQKMFLATVLATFNEWYSLTSLFSVFILTIVVSPYRLNVAFFRNWKTKASRIYYFHTFTCWLWCTLTVASFQ